MNRKKVLVLSLTVVAGVCWGASTAPRPAHACECTEPTWNYRMKSVEALDGGRDHSLYWPEAVDLTAYEGVARLWAGERGPETLDQIAAEARVGVDE